MTKIIQVPITSKPLPALLAPPTTNMEASFSSCYSSSSCFSSPIHSATDASSIQSKLPSEPSPQPILLPQIMPSTTSYYSVTQAQSKEIQELRQDLIKLNQKYIQQIERIQIAEQARHQVESELEDLSLRLFEQANEMVAEERKKRYYAEKKVAQLERELGAVKEELENEKAQLSELRERFEENSTEEHGFALTERTSPYTKAEDSVSIIPHTLGLSSPTCLDNSWLNVFKDFLTLAPTTPIESLHKLPFMKQCLDLDIEPCLRFGNARSNSRLSFRKVFDAIIHQPCFIESEPSEKRPSQDNEVKRQTSLTRRHSFAFSFSNKSRTQPVYEPIQHCYGCRTELGKDALFRCRLKEQDHEWFWIDRACRDRLVAVCNFYVFIRHIQSGLQSQKTIDCLFRECIWLRLYMFWARSGIHHSTHAMAF
ncbi:uncharacterized protein B0P05DRAFT_536731 [Gilbertella persicaria]|uniref:RAB3A interacting protein n=1 Tax=Rhizopus stolonifer TaxID=4846 RepID=A0A367K419_RHIST|nr:uncharacterized protein B0P05DRAFT_536731 [Gilbertella persicaria]KAI8083266.1 hypothetical protein B0P05DRAFT_536731 [Gilbertella persicaria]RCH96954.1 RAB3A interacting protein [Rhizopus stolonifer]